MWCRHACTWVFFLPSVSRQSPAALEFLGSSRSGLALRLTCAGVLCELGWPDAERLAMGRLLSLLGRSFSMARGPGMPTVRRRVDLVVSPSLNLALHQRLQASIHSLSTTRLPGSTFSVNAGPDVFVYGRGSSPEHARFWSLARWGHDPLPCGRTARHLGLPESLQIL